MPIDNTIGLFEVSTGRRLHHDESTPVGDVVSAAWSPSGDRLVTGHADWIRAGLGRRDRQADLAQAPGTRHQPERLERPAGVRELLTRRQARRRGRAPGRSGEVRQRDRCDLRGRQWPDGARGPSERDPLGGACARRADGRRRHLARQLRRYALHRDRGRDGPDPLGQPARGPAGRVQSGGRHAIRGEVALVSKPP